MLIVIALYGFSTAQASAQTELRSWMTEQAPFERFAEVINQQLELPFSLEDPLDNAEQADALLQWLASASKQLQQAKRYASPIQHSLGLANLLQYRRYQALAQQWQSHQIWLGDPSYHRQALATLLLLNTLDAAQSEAILDAQRDWLAAQLELQPQLSSQLNFQRQQQLLAFSYCLAYGAHPGTSSLLQFRPHYQCPLLHPALSPTAARFQ
ncbi:hypothetical protein [Aliagarivorans marinus]|uniref:hypothetical protein n=1 Tax=Aliagarivorans marinus TaxID=561965 RepID=UPI00041E6667|nr:hypothetical protein [Aliagarivorans marinus]